jgi:hypothetical protein
MGASLASIVATFALLWRPHMAVLSHLLGTGLLCQLAVSVLLLAESALPIVLFFQHRLDRLAAKLFDTTLQLKLGKAATAPAGGSAARAADSSSMTAEQAAQAAALRGGPVAAGLIRPLQPSDRAALAALLAARRAARRGTAAPGSLAASAGALLMRLLVQPKAGDGVLMRKARDLATLATGLVIPGAALLLPLAVYRDSGAEMGELLSRWLAAKGVADPDAQEAVVKARQGQLRGFALMATGLTYVPVLSYALALSNHVAAALYVASLEKRGAPLLS